MKLHLLISLDSRTNIDNVALWVTAHSFEVFGNTVSYFVTKRSTEQHFMTLSLP